MKRKDCTGYYKKNSLSGIKDKVNAFFTCTDLRNIKSPVFSIITTIIFCLLFQCAFAQEPGQTENFTTGSQDTVHVNIAFDDDLFASEEPLEITLAFDIRGFQRTKDQPQDFDATITVKTSSTDSVTQEISLRARGESRRRICDFPPISLNLKKLEGPAAGLQNQGKLKLVTHCKQSSLYEGYVLKEYLAYKLFNLVSPYSYKTRLVRVHYVDINRPDKPYTAYGFIIEDTDDMAERNHSVEIDNPNITQKDMIPEHMVRVALFNFMIGNTDWAVPSLHNIKLLKSLELFTAQAIPVPYDFDFSGFVCTSYSAPAPALPIKNVMERYYMGICVPDEDLNTILDEFWELKEDILGTINNCEYFSSSQKKQTASFIESYYKMYDRRNILIQTVKNTCK
ncbi:MAG: hypothetical protein JXB19_00520 [Bacteroidales bacterium]|nr:hypothetical protein [Bacteroidales bacterium]